MKYICEKCGREFSQKSHYDSHRTRKIPCHNIIDKFTIALDTAVQEKLTKQLTPYKVTSLFSGIGGMDLGFGGNIVIHKKSLSKEFKKYIDKPYYIKNFIKLINTPFKIIFQNDILSGAKDICHYNNIDNNYIVESIFNLINNNYIFPTCDVVIGGFPCQDFSHAGKRLGFQSTKSHNLKGISDDKNNRGTLYKSFVEVVKQIQPKIFVAENVYGLLTMKGDPIKTIIADFRNVGYNVEYQIISTEKYGIPQTRKRVIIIGINNTRKRHLLNNNWNVINYNKVQCCVGNYFEHLQEPNETEDISQQVYSKAKKLTTGQGQKEINLNSFSPTIRAEHHGNIEFRRYKNSTINNSEKHLQERRLTVREAGLIQTFPPDFIFSRTKVMTAYKYIGNAVPPLLSYLISMKVSYLLSKYF